MSKAGLSLLTMGVVCLTGLLWCGAPAQAAAGDQRVRTAQQAFNTAQTKADQARQAWDKAAQDLAKAESTHVIASNKVHQARQSAAQKHGAELGMTAAISERDAALHHVNQRRNALEAELKTRPDYQTAESEAEAARKRLSELADDKSLSESQQAKSSAELAAKIRRPTEMRAAAEKDDAEIKQATRRWQAAGAKIAGLQPQLKKAVDSDPSVTKASEAEKQSATALEKARTGNTRAEQAFNTAQTNLDRHSQQLQAALAARKHR